MTDEGRRVLIPDNWDMAAEVVVVGFGAAGVATAVTAFELGAEVLILEKAPEGQEGGNTRVAGQGYLNTSSAEKAAAYLKALCGPYPVPDEMIRVWSEEMSLNNDWLAGLGGDPQEHQHQPEGIEFPDLPGADCVHKFHDGPTYGFSNTWKRLESLVKQRPIRVCYETPGRELIQDRTTGEILGVRAAQGGKSIFVKARKAVVLTCGGFENNQEMIRNYLSGVPYCYTSGSPFNEGDGISMALKVGADLWHMNNYAGPSMALKVPEFPTTFGMQALHFSKIVPGGMIVAGPDGRRFTDEKLKTRHGKVASNGTWQALRTPCPMHMVFDQTLMASGPLYDKTPSHGWTQIVERYDWSEDNGAEFSKGWIKTADTIAELARAIRLDPNSLSETVDRWNAQAAAGLDGDFRRTLMLAPFDRGPYYAVELSPSMLNTQGGPQRNEHGQVLQPGGAPIPRLYSAGELGSIYSYLYQGTGNIGECLAFGRVAARNAVAESLWS
ncbi:MAG: FAD-binding protein [Alphaproteobacteria bacterium]|nr:FAD-binding protein [Alphaproteobacteria bacterium]MDP6813078.1 FAD-binding protein [Alphaproteobacteria bacterium]